MNMVSAYFGLLLSCLVRVCALTCWPWKQATVANLLEAVLFHAEAAAALGDSAALELCDWACRRLLHLNTGAHAFANAPGMAAASWGLRGHATTWVLCLLEGRCSCS